jgi:hypothetical protein
MIPPFPLYFDEISPDKIKAVVSTGDKILQNLRTMSLDMPISNWPDLSKLNGMFIIPIGRFICMLARENGKTSMIFLDLVGKEDLAQRMAEKLLYANANLREEFMNAYQTVVSHPENHRKFRLAAGS